MSDDIETAKPIKKLEVDQHTNCLIYFDSIVEGYGIVRIETWGHGLEVWVGGEKRAEVEPTWIREARK